MMLAIGCDNLIRWDEMKNASSQATVSDATVSFTLRNASLEPVASAANVTMAAVLGQAGRYEGVLESTVSLTPGARYFLDVTAQKGGLVGFRRIACQAQYAGAN